MSTEVVVVHSVLLDNSEIIVHGVFPDLEWATDYVREIISEEIVNDKRGYGNWYEERPEERKNSTINDYLRYMTFYLDGIIKNWHKALSADFPKKKWAQRELLREQEGFEWEGAKYVFSKAPAEGITITKK